ncbi:oleate hydratase [Aequitasia blattaphilus]|uniref:Oleate hydratase n=1 Tax=Aequitasia blattaphilus TaxID=2949332 RepID=A0ABT1E8B5_9FIRM|nr:oleate hydratase [Aequitasia blattaphilus]MCP1102079.1 oleate hydratase [Aequitasia blattaphilus]MCR8614719.1 oleate hydratase [Aequitasia blattaphilus]
MYYSNGNYEAFAKPKKPENVDKKSAYLVGGGLASLAAAAFLLRDGQLKGENIHIFEQLDIPGGGLDGLYDDGRGFIIRGGREMENHFECLWDLFRSIPSLEVENASVLDEFYWLNKEDPNFSLERAIQNRGESAHTDGKFTLSDTASMEIMKLFFTPEESLANMKITDVFSEDFFQSNFWLYWQTMFAFEPWHSAMEMRRYIARFIHHIGGLPDFSALKFTKYNQYESLTLPLIEYLQSKGVDVQYGITVDNVLFDISTDKKVAKKILYTKNKEADTIDLSENDLVFITNGSNTESSSLGDQNTKAELSTDLGGSWNLWKNIAPQDPAFGNPDVFCGDIPKSNWESATITTLDMRIPPYIEKICKRDPFSGKVVTGGIVTIKDSKWLMSFTLNRQPHFKKQPKDQLTVWIYSLYCDVPGDYIKKPMKDCTGVEITEEWLYHLGVPENEIEDMAKNSANSVPCMMPFVTSYFMPRKPGDRPLVVPKGSVNAAFIGNFAETPRDTVFTTEYSVRTAMEAVYTLLDIDRGVPEVFGSAYDVRVLLDSTHKMMDGKKLTDIKLPLGAKMVEHEALKKMNGTMIMKMLQENGLI